MARRMRRKHGNIPIVRFSACLPVPKSVIKAVDLCVEKEQDLIISRSLAAVTSDFAAEAEIGLFLPLVFDFALLG